jgi:hypothetical protein
VPGQTLYSRGIGLPRSIATPRMCTRQHDINPTPFGVIGIAGQLFGDKKLTIPDLPFKPPNPLVARSATAGSHDLLRLRIKKRITQHLDR